MAGAGTRKKNNRSLIGQHLVQLQMKFSDDCHYGGEIVDSTEKNDKNTPKPKMLKLLPNQINVINSGSESDINNKMQVIVERDAESNDRQTEKIRKM